MFRNPRFHQIAKANQENIRRLISNEDYQLNSDSNEDKQLIDEVLNKAKSSFNAGEFLQIVEIFSSMTILSGSSEDLGRTYQYLIDSLSTGANICLICIDIIQKTDAVRIDIFERISCLPLSLFDH